MLTRCAPAERDRNRVIRIGAKPFRLILERWNLSSRRCDLIDSPVWRSMRRAASIAPLLPRKRTSGACSQSAFACYWRASARGELSHHQPGLDRSSGWPVRGPRQVDLIPPVARQAELVYVFSRRHATDVERRLERAPTVQGAEDE